LEDIIANPVFISHATKDDARQELRLALEKLGVPIWIDSA
jgi:hypothetical protein